jgi:UDP-N-acetylglucosamine:LPS N-acetylglucosamine transferase
VICLPLRSAFYHPDLVQAADAVIGKVGYSTLAEVHHSGVPFGYISRRNYPEMPGLIAFVERHVAGLELHDADLGAGVEPDFIDRLLALPRRPPAQVNGADEIAEFLC